MTIAKNHGESFDDYVRFIADYFQMSSLIHLPKNNAKSRLLSKMLSKYATLPNNG